MGWGGKALGGTGRSPQPGKPDPEEHWPARVYSAKRRSGRASECRPGTSGCDGGFGFSGLSLLAMQLGGAINVPRRGVQARRDAVRRESWGGRAAIGGGWGAARMPPQMRLSRSTPLGGFGGLKIVVAEGPSLAE